MSGGLPRLAAGLLAVLACALLLAACGGGGDSDSTASTDDSGATANVEPAPSPQELEELTHAPAEAPPAEKKPAEPSEPKEKATPQSEQGEWKVYEHKRYGNPSKESAPFDKYSGKASEGKLRLALYGDEAPRESRVEATTVVDDYLHAIDAGEWEKACSYRAAVPELGACAKALPESLKQPMVHDLVSIFPMGGIASMRIEEGGLAKEGVGFALFHGSDGKDYWMVVRRESGQWKVDSMVPQPFER